MPCYLQVYKLITLILLWYFCILAFQNFLRFKCLKFVLSVFLSTSGNLSSTPQTFHFLIWRIELGEIVDPLLLTEDNYESFSWTKLGKLFQELFFFAIELNLNKMSSFVFCLHLFCLSRKIICSVLNQEMFNVFSNLIENLSFEFCNRHLFGLS